MAMRLAGKIGMAGAVLIALLLLFAWVDAGREEQRLIEQPVSLPDRS